MNEAFESPDSIEALTKKLGDPSEDVRKIAVEKLADIYDPRTLDPLMQVLHNVNGEDEFVRREALFGLELQNATKELRECLVDANMGDVVRSECAYALGRLADPAAAQDLFESLEDKNRLVRQAASAALSGSSFAPQEVVDEFLARGSRRQQLIAEKISAR